MREMTRVRRGEWDCGDTIPFFYLKMWFVTALKDFCFRKDPFGQN